MKKNEKEKGTKEKLLKGATAAGVALGGAMAYGQGNVVYAAESTTSNEEIQESELSEAVSEQEVAASEASEVEFNSEAADVAASEASEVEYASETAEVEKSVSEEAIAPQVSLRAAPARGAATLNAKNDTTYTSELNEDHDHVRGIEYQGEDTDVNYADCIKNSHHVSRVLSEEPVEIEIEGETYLVEDGNIVARLDWIAGHMVWDGWDSHWEKGHYEWNYNFETRYRTAEEGYKTFSSGIEVYRCHGQAYAIRYSDTEWVEFRTDDTHVYHYAVRHGDDWDLMDDNSYQEYSDSVSMSDSQSEIDSTSTSLSDSTSTSLSDSTSTSLSDSTSTSLSDSTSTSLSDSTSTSLSDSTSTSLSDSTSTSLSDSTSTSLSDSTSTSLSDSTSTSLSDSTSTSLSDSTSTSLSDSTSTSLSDSTSTSLSDSTSTSLSDSTSTSLSDSTSTSLSDSTSTSLSDSTSTSLSDSTSTSLSDSTSTSLSE